MPYKYRNSHDSTQPIPPPATPYNASSPSPQGKLVLGSFNNPPSQRQPYAYPPRPPQQVYNTNVPSHDPRNRKKPRRHPVRNIGCVTVLVLIAIVVIVSAITVPRVFAFGDAISTEPPLSMSGDMNSNNRVNLLVMGYGGGVHDGAYLMDSLVTISLLPQSHHTSLVSVPRDLWVENPYTTESKINAIYTVASNNNEDPSAGGKAMADTVSSVTGLNVKYWMTIDFNGFRELINSIGGIDVYVPNSFSADYPNNDDPTVDASWTTVTFEKGNQHMDGETAIRYARARYVTDNLAEGTDFARSARQQIIMKAVMSKIQDIGTWPKLFDALNALQDTVRTNMSLADLTQFARAMDLNNEKTARIGLSTVLANDTASDGQAILVPQNGLAEVASYVDENLYKEEKDQKEGS